MEIYTIKEIAKAWHCDVHIVYDLIKQGRLKAFTIDTGTKKTSLRVRANDLDDFLKNLPTTIDCKE
ncbi:helix-turn-helix domain-containing protein [Ruminococcus sp. HUN007]|uniref:helix-turn-helix domain-containing protein n=1 Tax=Ruminococcus sp. HUN007 TaxID=1514668 RepID=UPI0005D1E542|nr:helix-turn-helix domain-containing protein [Ruminococcus sp. HUN007]